MAGSIGVLTSKAFILDFDFFTINTNFFPSRASVPGHLFIIIIDKTMNIIFSSIYTTLVSAFGGIFLGACIRIGAFH